MTAARARVLVTDAASEPVTVSEIKDHARILNDEADSYLTAVIGAARRLFERDTGIVLINQTWRANFDAPAVAGGLPWWDGMREGALPASHVGELLLAPTPVGSVTSVKTYSPEHAETTLSAAAYQVDVDSAPARLSLNPSYSWPTPLRIRNAVTVTFVSGYGATASDVPADIRHMLKMLVTHFYENRGDVLASGGLAAQSQSTRMADFMKGLVGRYRTRLL